MRRFLIASMLSLLSAGTYAQEGGPVPILELAPDGGLVDTQGRIPADQFNHGIWAEIGPPTAMILQNGVQTAVSTKKGLQFLHEQYGGTGAFILLDPRTGRLDVELLLPDGSPADLPGRWTITSSDGEPVLSSDEMSGAVSFDDLLPGRFTVDVMVETDDHNGLMGANEGVEITGGRIARIAMTLRHLESDIGDHGDPGIGGEDPATMISPDELAAARGPRTDIPFEIDQRCDGPDPCNVTDPRVGLDIMLPAGWGMSEAFYYTTAGGARAEHPTVDMANLAGSAFDVALNPRQWDAMLGPCEAVPMGQLCRTESEVVSDLADYALIRDSFLGIKPLPAGYSDIGRSWTLENRLLGGMVGLMKIDSPQPGDETVGGLILLSNPAQFGLETSEVIDLTISLFWHDDNTIESLFAQTVDDTIPLGVRLTRPEGWDGTTNFWTGEVTNNRNFRGALVNVF